MSKLKVAILFGGKSGEHEVSIVSATSVFQALDKTKYDVTLVGIDKQGRWLLPEESALLAHSTNPRLFKLNESNKFISPVPYTNETQLVSLSEGKAISHKFDVIIPILHGTFGEDGVMQGLLELTQTAYVGSGVLGSAVGMDKDVSRRLLKLAEIPVVPTLCFKKSDFQKNGTQIIEQIITEIGLPFFVKPANAGSSVGIHKVKTQEDAQEKIKNSFLYDNKVLVEKAIQARELECAVLGHHEPQASIVGEIVPKHEFYTYEAKYIDENGAELKVPAPISTELQKQIQELSLKAFKTLELSGMARVDFFLDKNSNEIYLNEVNTIPGFTKISMYPKLWEASGIPYPKLLDKLIDLAIEKHQEKSTIKTEY